MTVMTKSASGIALIPKDTRLLSERKIFVEGEINPSSAVDFVKKLMILNAEDSELPITVCYNSPGGEINSGMLMYDAIQGSKAPIRSFCLGRAYSMAGVLFASGPAGRYMLPHSEVMLHEPLLGNSVGGSSSSIKSISESLLETKRKLNQVLAKHTGKSEEEVEKATSYDHYFSPEESMEFGLCDEIVEFNKLMEVQ